VRGRTLSLDEKLVLRDRVPAILAGLLNSSQAADAVLGVGAPHFDPMLSHPEG
jgi:hypothetical protein